MATRFDLDLLTRDPALVAQAALAEDVFSFLTRQIVVPAGCVALAFGESSQPALVSTGRTIEAGDVRELFFARICAFDLVYELDALRSSDGHDFSASATISVQLVPERTELEAFRKSVLGSQRRVRDDRLRQYCEDAVRTAAASLATSLTAEELIAPESWTAFDDILLDQFKPVGFESGLALGRDPRITFRSPSFIESRRRDHAATLRQQRLAEDAAMQEAAARAREKHLAEVAEMLEKVKAMSRESGGLSIPELIKTFDPAQRGRLYHGLMATGKPLRRTEAVLVVAGDELLRFDPADMSKPVRRQALPGGAGPLRSVRIADENGTILVGARNGVHLIKNDDAEVRTYLFDDRPDIRGGVNSAALFDGHIYATHSEVGLIQWPVGSPGEHRLCLEEITESSRAVRDIRLDQTQRLWFGVDQCVIGWRPGDDAAPIRLSAPCEVTAMLPARGDVTAGLKDGSVLRWLMADPAQAQTIRPATGDPVRSLAWLSGGGVGRLLIGDGRPHLDLHVLGDSYHGEYRCGQNLRWGFATEDLIVGVNDRRDQLFVWRVDEPETPASGVSVGRLTGHSIQDAALLAQAVNLT